MTDVMPTAPTFPASAGGMARSCAPAVASNSSHRTRRGRGGQTRPEARFLGWLLSPLLPLPQGSGVGAGFLKLTGAENHTLTCEYRVRPSVRGAVKGGVPKEV